MFNNLGHIKLTSQPYVNRELLPHGNISLTNRQRNEISYLEREYEKSEIKRLCEARKQRLAKRG